MKQCEKGFTAIEIAIFIAIGAIIVIGASMTTVQILKSTDQDSNLLTAARQAQNLGYHISQDALMAQIITIGDDLGTTDEEFITIAWGDWETGYSHYIRYLWFDSADSLKMVKRNSVTKNTDNVTTSNTMTLIADNIYTANLFWHDEDDAWRLSVEAQAGDKSLTREYEISKRVAH